jgi:hypothetical protein
VKELTKFHQNIRGTLFGKNCSAPLAANLTPCVSAQNITLSSPIIKNGVFNPFA